MIFPLGGTSASSKRYEAPHLPQLAPTMIDECSPRAASISNHGRGTVGAHRSALDLHVTLLARRASNVRETRASARSCNGRSRPAPTSASASASEKVSYRVAENRYLRT